MKKSILKYSIFLLLTWPLLSCEDDEGGVLFTNPPVTSAIDGPEKVEIASTGVTYSVSQRRGSTYAWNVTGAEIAEASTIGSVKINFTTQFPTPSEPAVITIVETDERGVQAGPQTLEITIEVSQPRATSIFAATGGPLREGSSDFAIAVFDKPLQTPPEFEVLSVPGLPVKGALDTSTGTLITAADTVSKFSSEAVRELFRDGDPLGGVYYVQYTAGPGNAEEAEVSVSSAVAVELHGGLTMNPTVGAINEIDNTSPRAEITFSSELAKVGDEITITVTFNEPLRNTNSSAVTIGFASTGGIPGLLPTAMSTETDEDGLIIDSKVWTLKYIAGGGDGLPEFIVSEARDRAGNAQESISTEDLEIDNTSPLPFNEIGVQVNAELFASLSVDSNEDGMVYYGIVENDSIPTVAEVVSGNPTVLILSDEKSVSLETSATASFTTGLLDPDDYDVYFVIEDKAGNLSALSDKVDLSIN